MAAYCDGSPLEAIQLPLMAAFGLLLDVAALGVLGVLVY
jgi:hypothetical protein